jgi:uncharacterized SAM-binding protein YcdF (DUF218 family)
VNDVADRELPLPSDEDRASDRELLAALGEHEPIGERYARTGEVPVSTARRPGMEPSPNTAIERDPTPVKPIPRPPRFVGRYLVRGAIVVVAVGALYVLFTLWQVWSTGRSDQARPVDAIVVLGAAQYDGTPSPQLAARLDHAVELWPDGLAPRIVATGGSRPGDRFTEAEAATDYLVAAGIPADVIVSDVEGASTYESLADLRTQYGDEIRSVLIVTDPYHSLRSRMIAAELGFDAFVSPAGDSVVTGGEQFRRELEETAGVALGRIIGFDRLERLTD